MNLFADLSQDLNLPEELIETLAESQYVRIERIVSTGHSSPPRFWYDQLEYEWVVVLRGYAILEFEDRKQDLAVGDHILISPHTKHRVFATFNHAPTVWLAVFFQGSDPP